MLYYWCFFILVIWLFILAGIHPYSPSSVVKHFWRELRDCKWVRGDWAGVWGLFRLRALWCQSCQKCCDPGAKFGKERKLSVALEQCGRFWGEARVCNPALGYTRVCAASASCFPPWTPSSYCSNSRNDTYFVGLLELHGEAHTLCRE